MTDLSNTPPRLFWGWVVVLGGFVLMAVSYGARYSFGVFVQPLTVENGWSRSVVSITASINLLAYALGGILSGRLLDRVAPRWVATAGAVIGAAGFLLCAWVTSPLGLYLAYGVLYGFGSSWTGTVVVNSSVGKWFVERRGLRDRHRQHGDELRHDHDHPADGLADRAVFRAGGLPRHGRPAARASGP